MLACVCLSHIYSDHAVKPTVAGECKCLCGSQRVAVNPAAADWPAEVVTAPVMLRLDAGPDLITTVMKITETISVIIVAKFL